MIPENDLKAVCSVTALAKKLGLSRARFYQLQKKGVFPVPVYCTRTRHPFYSSILQQKCIDIRKTGIGLDGHAVTFNTSRKAKASRVQNTLGPQYEELSHILKQMGLSVSPKEVKNATNIVYPMRKIKFPVENEVVVELYKYFQHSS